MGKLKSAAIITITATLLGGSFAGWQLITGIQDRAAEANTSTVRVHNDSSTSHNDIRKNISKSNKKITNRLKSIEEKLDRLIESIYQRRDR